MKHVLLFVVLFPFLFACNSGTSSQETENIEITEKPIQTNMNDELLRHVVLIKFKEGTSAEDIAKVEDAFGALENKIQEIKGYEWGTNNSPEGINKGFTHCFMVTFDSEEGREIYLPHPDHKAFVEVLSPHMEDVLVVDYWAK